MIICDQGPNNRSALTKLGLIKENPYYIQVDDSRIFAMYDVPHLVKNVSNNLLTIDIFKNNRVSFYDIKKT